MEVVFNSLSVMYECYVCLPVKCTSLFSSQAFQIKAQLKVFDTSLVSSFFFLFFSN